MIQASTNTSIDIIITKALLQLGFSPANNGFYFLRDAVKLAYFDNDVLLLITKFVYLPLAKTYKTTDKNIEKSIRMSAESVWKKNNNQRVVVLNNYYEFSSSKPENKELITLLLNFVKEAVDIFYTDIGKSI